MPDRKLLRAWARAETVAIVKLSSMGDVIHALPVSAAIGRAFPGKRIVWIVEDQFAPLLAGNPYVHEVVTLPRLRLSGKGRGGLKRYVRVLSRIRKMRPGVVIDLQGLSKSAVVSAASGAPARIGYHFMREMAPLVSRPIPPRPTSLHVVDQYLDVVGILGADLAQVSFPIAVSDDDRHSVAAKLAAAGVGPDDRVVTVNPAAGMRLKQWPAERFAALIERIQQAPGVKAVVVTADNAVAAQVRAACRSEYCDLAGRTTLGELAAVLERSQVHVCCDTGSGHLAAALRIPTVSLIGPTDPDRLCPYAQDGYVVSHKDRCDSRCTSHRCVFEHPRCMAAITVDEVEARIVQALGAVTA